MHTAMLLTNCVELTDQDAPATEILGGSYMLFASSRITNWLEIYYASPVTVENIPV